MLVNLSAKDENPLLTPYKTPFNVPPFDKIKPEHFLPAFKYAIAEHQKEINKIADNKQAPTFENTIEEMEYSGQLLGEIANIFFNLNSANTNKEIQEIAKEAAPLLSEHSDNISLNEKLFERVAAVYKQKDKLKLNTEQATLLEDTYKSFIRGGAGLDKAKKERFRELNKALSLATLKFGENLLAETNSYKLVIEDKKDLAGLPQSIIDAAAHDGKWVFTLQNPSVMAFLQYADNRELREKIFKAYSLRVNNGNVNDNKEVIRQIVNLRLERAQLLGYKNHAEFALEESMAKTPARVMDLMNKLWNPALNVAKKEAEDIQKMIDSEGGKFKLEPWDWRYYAEKVRKEKYNLDEEEIRPYLQLENVRKGIFELTNRLYGINRPEYMTWEVNTRISPLIRTRSRMVKEIVSRISARLPPTSRWTLIAVMTRSRSSLGMRRRRLSRAVSIGTPSCIS
jgi:peptidyl-dipeptidase Dcp